MPVFQLLKYFQGPLEPVGTAVLPGLALFLLALVPWLDRGPDRRPSRRKLIVGAGCLAAAATGALLYLGAQDKPKNPPISALGKDAEPPPDPKLLGGLASFDARRCATCHGAEGKGAVKAPDGFALAGRKLSLAGEKLTAHLTEKSPAPSGPPADGEDPDRDLPSLVALVEALQDGPMRLDGFSAGVRQGGAVVDREECRNCHAIYGEGGKRAPALARIAGKRDKAWLVGHFKDPKKFVPGSKMPAFKDLPEAELAAMSDYLLALP